MPLDILRNSTTLLKISDIRTDGGTQPRAGLTSQIIIEYAEAITGPNDWPFPPVVVFHDGNHYWLADGFHRLAAAKMYADRNRILYSIIADIRQGTQRDAILYSVGANADHGLRRTNEDKRRAVLRLLEDTEWNQWSNREIARRCRVDEKTVRSLRDTVTAENPQLERTYTTKHGAVATMNTANIGASAKPTASVDDLTRHVGSWLSQQIGTPTESLTNAASRGTVTRRHLEGFLVRRDVTFTAADLETAIAEVITNVVNTGTGGAPAPAPATVTTKDFDVPAPERTAAGLPPMSLVERATGKPLVQAFDNADYQIDEREASIAPFTPADRQAIKRATATSLPDGTYNVILADPPWQYNNTGLNGAAANHYPTMSMSQLSSLLNDIQLDVAANAVLFMWATNPMLADALDLINDWRFTYKTNIVWVKDRIGTGFYVRGMHELLLIATRGAFTPLETNHTPPLTSVITAPTQEHSRKPDDAYQLIEALYPGCSYIELFARRTRDGWSAWGNEVNQ